MPNFTLYKARTIHAATDAVLSAIKATEGRHIVIAPDAFTLAVEQTISNKLGKESVFHVEVMSFARLASVMLGEKIKKCLSPSGSVMLMEKVLCAKEKELRHYSGAARKQGFASEVYAAITSIRNSGVSPDQLFAALPLLKGRVEEKTHDLALLYQSYLTELQLNHTDGTTRLEALISELEGSEEIGDVHFSVVDHVDLNAKQAEVVGALMTRAASVSVAVSCGYGASNNRIYPKLYERLHCLAREKRIQVREVDCTSDLCATRALLADELFAYSFAKAETDPTITLAEAKDIREEITYLATEITRLVRKEKLRYCDVAVLTPSFEEYRPQVERIFRKYGIPLFSDERYPLSDSALFRYVIGAMQAALSGYDPLLMEAHISQWLFTAATTNEKADFCDYVDKSGAKYSVFKHPFSLFEGDRIFAGAEKVRSLLIEELSPLADLPSSAELALYCEKIRDYLRVNDFDERIKSFLKEVEDAGLLKQAEILRRTPAALMDLLDTLEELRGNEKTTFREFILSLQAGAGQMKIASLPVRLDCVYFAPVEQAMYAPIEALFVLGAEDGLFPLESVKEGILGSREYEAWQSHGIEIKIENVGMESLKASKFHALQALLRGKRIYLSHVESKTKPFCMRQISEIFSIGFQKCSALLETCSIEELIPTRTVAEDMLVEYSRRSRESLLSPKEERFARAIALSLQKQFPLPVREDGAEKVSADIFFLSGTVSSTELETYFKCPFKHFVQFGLQAKERVVAKSDVRDYGNMAHHCMETFLKEHVMVRAKDNKIDDAEAEQIVRNIALKYVSSPRFRSIAEKEGGKKVRNMIELCVKVAKDVKNQIYHSKFLPTMLEKSFGYGNYAGKGDLSAPVINGVVFCGRIDRVDILSKKNPENEAEVLHYAVTIDYKSGDNQIDVGELFLGKKVQLPLYLAVLKQSGYLPVAALYASVKGGASGPFLFGPKLASYDLMNMIDDTLESGRSTYMNISQKEKVLSFTKGSGLSSKEEFAALSEYALKVSEGAVQEIKEGFIRPTPLYNSFHPICSNCLYKAICKHKARDRREDKVAISPAEIKEIMQQKEGEQCR